MAKRDPHKTARNKMVAAMQDQLRDILPKVLKQTGIVTEASLNAIIGSKTDEFIDLKNEIINSPEEYVVLWMEGFQRHLSTTKFRTSYDDLFDKIKASQAFKEYLHVFLRRSYLKHYEELYRRRPTMDESEIWIGQNNADYGLLVTPRFSNGKWENDRSEIRHFKPAYFSIGHVLETGLVIPDKNKRMKFNDVEQYLDFFEHVLVRSTASPYQKAIAAEYCEFVRAAPDPLKVPLLIPEYRYEGRVAKHKYRLDFTIINPDTMDKVGFELSPWSTHGYLAGTAKKTQATINEEASGNFDKEMAKLKSFFKTHGIYSLIYTDKDLKSIDDVFSDIETYLKPPKPKKQLSFHFINNFFK
ncbi:topoisomerase [Bradyrhizobium sp. 40]|uniref:hypothetical protein n=1 Tax=Bradyrhizobium sp. 40 TaxID=2782674 RepID=UPI001FFE5284|nr:hypothetical protein [Bradyrhizobium sp. 40]UPJ44948.1 topoisomerase [Bradyrhizobium sp. 40]